MGEVYRATDPKLGREVAIKVLPDAVAADPDRLARFEREAKALAALNHPNVATIYGIEQATLDGRALPFLVMELVEGPTLAERIERGALGWREAARIFLEIARGLEAAHERGIVHRDLKPANVKIGIDEASGGGRVKVLDFGLAKAMAPEQARGAEVDKRADIWAFGVCLFEALTGRVTFDGDTLPDKLASVLKEDPDWVLLPEDLPPVLVSLLRRCLVKPAGERLRVRSLDSFDDSTRVITGTDGALYPFFSPDSEWIGYFKGGGGVRTLYRVNVESGSILPITTGTHPGYRADWGADGTIVMGEQRGAMRRIDIATGELDEHFTQVNADDGEIAHVHPEMLPDGRGVVFTSLEVEDSSTRIRVWNARSGEIRTLVPRGGEARYLSSGHLLYGVDGNLLLVGFDLETLTIVGDPRSIVQGIATGNLGEAYFDVSDNGTLIYLPGSAQQELLL